MNTERMDVTGGADGAPGMDALCASLSCLISPLQGLGLSLSCLLFPQCLPTHGEHVFCVYSQRICLQRGTAVENYRETACLSSFPSLRFFKLGALVAQSSLELTM